MKKNIFFPTVVFVCYLFKNKLPFPRYKEAIELKMKTGSDFRTSIFFNNCTHVFCCPSFNKSAPLRTQIRTHLCLEPFDYTHKSGV